MLKEFSISTQNKHQLLNITEKIKEIVKESKVKSGLILVFTLHTSAAILLNENEQGLKEDWFKVFEKITSGIDFSHNQNDDNGNAHIISSLIGNQKTFIIEQGELVLGTWQQIFLLELDGPRTRKVIIKII